MIDNHRLSYFNNKTMIIYCQSTLNKQPPGPHRQRPIGTRRPFGWMCWSCPLQATANLTECKIKWPFIHLTSQQVQCAQSNRMITTNTGTSGQPVATTKREKKKRETKVFITDVSIWCGDKTYKSKTGIDNNREKEKTTGLAGRKASPRHLANGPWRE